MHWRIPIALIFSAPLPALVVSSLVGQTGTLSGVVTDAVTGDSLEGVQIIVAGVGIRTLTASNGRYFLIHLTPGTYNVIATRIDYQTVEARNVVIPIDASREQHFALRPATTPQQLDAVAVVVQRQPMVASGATGSTTTLGSEQISALPITSIQGVLSLQQGFLEVPWNTDILSFTETRRRASTPLRVRGGRGTETLIMIDGVPIHDFVFGGPALDVTTEVVSQLDFQRGGFDPQYGDALSGIVNIATREGGTELAGALSWQSSAFGGALGNAPDDLLSYDLLQGYLSGPVPWTNHRLRFVAAGRIQGGADRVLEFDDDVAVPTNPSLTPNPPHPLDLFPGWRAFGYDHQRDLFGKLTYFPRPTMKLTLWATAYQRQRQPFDFDYLVAGFDPLGAPGVTTRADTLAIATVQPRTSRAVRDRANVVQGSMFLERDFVSARWDHTLGRWAYRATVSRSNQTRETCNVFAGVCLGDRFGLYGRPEFFIESGGCYGSPSTDVFYGGERVRTWMGRFDVQAQATDHHQLQGGAVYRSHDLANRELRQVGVCGPLPGPEFYTAQPWEAAVYIQDRIEYDFLTVKLGLRLDFGKASGLFFVNPLDLTNGTTAREVCNADPIAVERGLSDGVPFTFVDGAGRTLSGFEACAAAREQGNRDLMRQAGAQAQGDDFAETTGRAQVSPRIGVSFPLSERSHLFFNFGRYAQHPSLNNLYQYTNIGTDASSRGCDLIQQTKPNTTECAPSVAGWTTRSFLGNPNLSMEKTTSYEVGYATELGRDYALGLTAFAKEQFGLAGIRAGGVDSMGARVFDPAFTYQAQYAVLLNRDIQTVRGLEVSLRRRLSNGWGFSLNYTLSQAMANAAPPEREFQSQYTENDPAARQEMRSEVDRPHVFNGTVFFHAGDRPVTRGKLGEILRNTAASVTLSARSGFPYTPTLSFEGRGNDQLERYSGRARALLQVDLQASKDFALAAFRYGAFVRVTNLLDGRGCTQVFHSTGSCTDGTVDQDRQRDYNARVGTDTHSTYFDRPQFLQAPRSINVGLRVSF